MLANTIFSSTLLLLLLSAPPSLALVADPNYEPATLEERNFIPPLPKEEVHTGVITTYHPKIKVGIITSDRLAPKICHFNNKDTALPVLPLHKGYEVSYTTSVNSKGKCTAHGVTLLVPLTPPKA